MKSLFLILAVVLFCPLGKPGVLAGEESQKIPLTFTGGHETEPQDRGRPDVLIAAALGVPTEVFRQAFSGVHPAGPGSGGPTNEEAQANKRVLMAALGPYGVTDERLNAVSNHYRYRRDEGQMWPHVEAAGYATVANGVVTGFVITNSGSGYSSPPVISVAGMPDLKAVVTLSFSTDFDKNGAVKQIALGGGGPN